jgi:hypothetical protein
MQQHVYSRDPPPHPHTFQGSSSSPHKIKRGKKKLTAKAALVEGRREGGGRRKRQNKRRKKRIRSWFSDDDDDEGKGGFLTQRGVSHCGLAIYIKKYLKAKEELWKLKYFTMQKCNLQKIL